MTEPFDEAMELGIEVDVLGGVVRELSVMVTVMVVDDVLAEVDVGYGPADAVGVAAPEIPPVEGSMALKSTLLNLMAGPKHCLLKACPLVHSFCGELTKSDLAKLWPISKCS